jgi:5'-3' exonuclease
MKILKNNIILIDTSYISFYRFFATLKWYKLANPEICKKLDLQNYNWIENEEFMDKYNKMYLESIRKIISTKIYNDSFIIFCMDTPKEQVWRTKLQDTYKQEREDLTLKYNFKPVLKYTFKKLIPKILSESNVIVSFRFKHLEADDIIGIIADYIRDKNIYIISGDTDFYQLGRRNLYFISFKIFKGCKLLQDSSSRVLISDLNSIANYGKLSKNKKILELNELEAKLLLKIKILLGDKSDFISAVLPSNMSSKFKKNLIESDDLLNEYLDNNKEIKKKYLLNRKMIDFNFIPNDLKLIIINHIKKLL